MLILLRAAMRSSTVFLLINCNINFRQNNVPLAKGAVWCLKGMIWSNSLPLYREAFLRSSFAEEIQVRTPVFFSLIRFAQPMLSCYPSGEKLFGGTVPPKKTKVTWLNVQNSKNSNNLFTRKGLPASPCPNTFPFPSPRWPGRGWQAFAAGTKNCHKFRNLQNP